MFSTAPILTGTTVLVIIVLSAWGVSISLQEKSQVKSEHTAAEPSPTDTEKPTSEPSPTVSPHEEPTPTSSSTPTHAVSSLLSDWRYPDSEVVSQTSTTLSLRTNNNPETVTAWYKERIESRGFSAKTTVTTSTNDVIKNVLAGANGQEEVEVEINKSPENSFTSIHIKKS